MLQVCLVCVSYQGNGSRQQDRQGPLLLLRTWTSAAARVVLVRRQQTVMMLLTATLSRLWPLNQCHLLL